MRRRGSPNRRPLSTSLPPPPPDLSGFPSLHLTGARLCRIHRAGRNPWWFSDDGTGRFDLPAGGGRGTCYLAEEPAGCFLEVFRSWTLVPEAEVAVRRISRLPVAEALVADCTAPGSRAFGLTAEIHSTPDYEVTRSWAAAFAEAGFDGVRYFLRHDPGQRLAGLALFGPAGAPDWPAVPAEPIAPALLEEVEHRFGVRVLPTP